jgi:hypothetical protein
MAYKPLIEEPWNKVIEYCKEKGDNSLERLEWQYITEFLRGRPFTFRDYRNRKLVNPVAGLQIPGTNRRLKEDFSERPVDNHLNTIANSLTAKALSNYPFLVPQVLPATSEDADQDTAISSTKILQYYQKATNEEENYRESIGYKKSCGQIYWKDVWDPSAGGPGAMSPTGETIPRGDIRSSIVPPTRRLIQPGIPKDENHTWTGEKIPMPIEEVFDKYGVEVPEETDLINLDTLQSIDHTSPTKQQTLSGHAMVYEIYFKPTKKHKLGRLVIGTTKHKLYDGAWDSKLTAKYPERWHPYTKVPWLVIEGDYWAKSPLFYLTDHQKQLNKLYYRLLQSKKLPYAAFMYLKTSMKWDQIDLSSDNGIIKIPYESQPPQHVKLDLPTMDILAEIQHVIARMNDNAADYEVNRGQRTPGVNSGRQQQQLQMANTLQNSPLLTNIARGMREGHWKLWLQLVAVHFESSGRYLQITGEEGETSNIHFTPDQITSENITLATGQSFFLPPEQRNAELDRLFQMGAFGPPTDPAAIKQYTRLRRIGGGLEGAFADLSADETMAEIENARFESGDYFEKDSVEIEKLLEMDRPPINNRPLIEYVGWYQAAKTRMKAEGMMATGQITPEMAMTTSPPPVPGPEPEKPDIFILARDYEDHAVHIRIHNKYRKNKKFEEACLKNPELRRATDFHILSHKSFMQPSLPMLNSSALPTSPPQSGGPPAIGA